MDERPLIVQCVVRSIPCSGPIELYSFPSVLHNWCSKGRGMYYSVCGMVHIKEPLLANQSRPCSGGSAFTLTEWSFAINKIFPFSPFKKITKIGGGWKLINSEIIAFLSSNIMVCSTRHQWQTRFCEMLH